MDNKKILTIASSIIAGMVVAFGGSYLLLKASMNANHTPETSAPITASTPIAVQASAPASETKAAPTAPVTDPSKQDTEGDITTQSEAESGMAIYDPNPSDKTALNMIKWMYKKYQDSTDYFVLVRSRATPELKKVLNYANRPGNNCSILSDNDMMFNTSNEDYGYYNHNKVKVNYSGYGYAVEASVGKKLLVTYSMVCKGKACMIQDMVYPDGRSLKESLEKECM